MGESVQIEAEIFPLPGGAPRAERVLLHQDPAVAAACVRRRFDVHLLSALALRLLNFVHQTANGLRLIECEHELLGGIRLRRRPIGATRTGMLVHQVLDRMSRVFGRVVDCGNAGEVKRSRVVVRASWLVQASLQQRGS